MAKAKKAAKTSKADKAAAPKKAADGGAVDPNDTGSNSGGGLGTLASSAVGGLLTPFGDWFNGLEADFMNILNQSFNTLFFATCVALGALGIMWGLYLLFKDTAPVQGAKSVATKAAMVAAL